MQKLCIILESQKLTVGTKWKPGALVPHLFPWPKLVKLFKDIQSKVIQMLSVEMGF